MTTTRKSTRSLCVSRMLPAIAAITMAFTGGSVFATPDDGRAAINAKLNPTNIPALKAQGDTVTAEQADLLLALALALEDNTVTVSAADLAAGALRQNAANKVRADKDKIAGQVIATAVSSRNLANDPVQLAAVTKAVFDVNPGTNTKLRLTTAGQANALAGALKSAGIATAGNNIGVSLASVFSGDLSLLLVNTSKALGTSTAVASGALQNAVDGFFDADEVLVGGRKTAIQAAAEKVAATNPSAAGAFYGGLVLNNPAGAYTGDTLLGAFATSDILSNKKLAKAYGEILATTMSGHSDKTALATSLVGGGKSLATQSLIVQGILRAGVTSDVNGVVGAVIGSVTDRAAFAVTVSTGNGSDTAKLDAIVKRIANGQDVATKTKIGASVIGAIGAPTPSAANATTKSIFDSTGGGFTDDASRLKFGTDIVAKIKSYSAAGYMASAIAERNTADSLLASKASDVAQIAVDIMAKGPKAATDIAQQVSALSSITDRVGFADLISDKNKNFVQNAAVGISITDPNNAEFITHKAITHDYALVGTKLIGDTAALGKAATIGGAVASAVDEEKAADIGLKLADAMSVNGTKTIDKPIKLSSAIALATSLAEAIQAKPGVKTTNRMDELGEIAASIVKNILGKNGADAKALSTESELISGIGIAILKTLSKTPLSDKRDLKADQTEARDIAGSIAQTIFAASTTDVPAGQKNTLLGVLNGSTHTQGTLEKAFLKYSGKKGTSDYIAVTQAFQDVLAGAGGSKFETGSVTDKETDTKNG